MICAGTFTRELQYEPTMQKIVRNVPSEDAESRSSLRIYVY
jgi:hypothetical protein